MANPQLLILSPNTIITMNEPVWSSLIDSLSEKSLAAYAVHSAKIFAIRQKNYNNFRRKNYPNTQNYLELYENAIFHDKLHDPLPAPPEDFPSSLEFARHAARTYLKIPLPPFHLSIHHKMSVLQLTKITLCICQIKKDIAHHLFNLFAPNPLWKPSYHTTNTTQLAHTIAYTKNYSLCPILADALLDADCDNPQILNLFTQHNHYFSINSWPIQFLTKI